MDYSVEQRVISVILRSQSSLTGGITVDSTLDELGIDSVDGINLFYNIEEEFNIELPYAGMNVSSVREIISEINALLKNAVES